jgi:cell division cycle protein 37
MAPPSGFDYSKWDKLELSDDEDTHPGAQFIEENTLRRIKRESHERQEAERAERVASLEKRSERDAKRIAALESGAEEPSSPEELETLRASVAEAKAEIAKEARERKFNADEMCYVASERSLVGSACQPDAGPERLDYESYAKKYGAELDAASGMTFEEDYSDMAEFFKNRTHLLTEHAMGYLLLKCLYLEMGGDTAAMRRAARVGYALKSIGDFADAGKKEMKDAARPFFCRLADEPRVLKEYRSAYEDYCEKLTSRAAEKKAEEAKEAERKAAEAESDEPRALEEVPREDRLGPGGLDPVEVFEGLPKPMQDAFESGDVDALRAYVNELPMEEAKKHMRAMVDSGLWVATPGQEGTALQD